MPIKISKLWGNKKFTNLTNESKLLYIYLATNPSISNAGVLCPDIDVMCIQLNTKKDNLRSSTKSLIKEGYIHVGNYNGDLYWIVIPHFNSVSKSDTALLKTQKHVETLPKELQNKLKQLGIKTDNKITTFIKPTAEEVANFAMSVGYLVDGKEFVDYYESVSKSKGASYWVDGRGKRVRDWKLKITKVWCKEDNKLEKVKGAPQGFEYFHIIVNGKPIFPDSWKEGKPKSKSFGLSKKLQTEYERKQHSS